MECMQPAAGSLLIASATLVDPNFARCVLLVLESNEEGTLGVILNQPSETPVGEVLTPWQDLVNPPGVFFRGGPVELNAALAIGRLADRRATTTPARLAAGHGLARAWSTSTAPPTTSSAGSPGCGSTPGTPAGAPASSRPSSRRAAGTSYPPSAATCSATHPDRLWREILRRQPPPLSMLATLPEDATLN